MVAFNQLGGHAGPAVLAGTAGVVAWNDCETVWKELIRSIQWRTNRLKKTVRRGGYAAEFTEELMLQAAIQMPIRSSHGNAALAPAPYALAPNPMTKVQAAWYAYAEETRTEHCPAGQAPAYIEFHLTGPGGLRILYDYMNDGFLITDHYVTYYQITVTPLA